MATLRSSIESALVSHLTAEAVGATAYPGLSSGDKALPCVICKVRKLSEEPAFSGNFNALIELEVAAKPSDDDFDDICSAVELAVWNGDLPGDLQGYASGVTVFGFASPLDIEYPEDEDVFRAVFSFELHVGQIAPT